MDKVPEEHLRYLGLDELLSHWGQIMAQAQKRKPSYLRFLTDILEREFSTKKERSRQSRIKRARIPEPWVMETFPFHKQPNLKKKLVLSLYDSMDFLSQKQELVFIGPTGCGKTGLASSFLIHAINSGCRGLFIDFKELVDVLYQSVAVHNEQKVLKRFAGYEVLLIDELGYVPVNKEQAGLFFELMKRRHKRQTTLITTQLGFDEWGGFLQNEHLTAALLDRITENCTIFNMRECISIRPKKITYATTEVPSEKKDPNKGK